MIHTTDNMEKSMQMNAYHILLYLLQAAVKIKYKLLDKNCQYAKDFSVK